MSAAELVAEKARDRALADVGYVIIGSQENGATDTEIVGTVLDMVGLRMILGRIDPVDALAGSDL